MRRLALLASLALTLSGCGGDSPSKPQLTVSAASSLTPAFERIGRQFGAAKVRFQFAGSNALAAQIEQGARPDVFASANTKFPQQLHAKGLVEKPVEFTTNRLVVAVPSGSDAIELLDDLARRGVKIAAGAEAVPVGSYTRAVLSKLPAGERRRILANIRSGEPDVNGVVGKVASGAVDAGFVYVTDVQAAGGRLRAVELPEELDAEVVYAAAVVKGASNPAAARDFVSGLTRSQAQIALGAAGFGPAPL